MDTIHIPLEECHEGDILARPVYNQYGTTIINENTAINHYIKSKLVGFGVEWVWVYKPENIGTQPSESITFDGFEKKYIENVFVVKEIIHELAVGQKLDIKKINHVSNSIYSEINNTGFITQCLREIKHIDEYTYYHCINVALYSMLTAKWLKLSSQEIKDIIQAGLLHDIGKSKVPLNILNKPSNLSPEEFDIIKKHTIYGYEISKSIDNISEDIRQAILKHHEREDSSGYPIGANSIESNIYSKIVAIADVFDAMTTDRIYKQRVTPFEAFEMFSSTGLRCFHPGVSLTFVSNLSANYIGARVLLNSGEEGEIAFISPQNISKPIIRIESKYVDTSKNTKIKIDCVIK